MNIRITAIRHLMRSLRAHLGKKSPQTSYATDEPHPCDQDCSAPSRWSIMARHWQCPTPCSTVVLRIAFSSGWLKTKGVLLGVRVLLTEAVKANRRIAPAGEWLLDNFYLIEEQMQTAKRHLPTGYSRELPRLHNGQSAGLPRVYDIALETIAHGDGLVDPESLCSFVRAYQTVTILTFGELWAIPIMLRLALVENLRRVAARVATDRIHRNLANTWADQMIEGRGEGSQKPDSGHRGYGAVEAGAGQCFCCRMCAPPSRGKAWIWPYRSAGLNSAFRSPARQLSNWCGRKTNNRPLIGFP